MEGFGLCEMALHYFNFWMKWASQQKFLLCGGHEAIPSSTGLKCISGTEWASISSVWAIPLLWLETIVSWCLYKPSRGEQRVQLAPSRKF